ncbi:MAG TPA: glycosyltransferase family A protein [Chitinophagaceae bacterium]|nr:glycosyltransferase family A protein [Chitinophagaceae bacterium]
MSPKVSIILTTYNRAGLIMETIETVRNQSFKDWELIIVDDGSEDRTAELVSQLQDPRIKFIKAGRIGINGKVKNIGLAHATGEFIAFIDSDDLWAPTKLEKQLNALRQFPEAGFSLTGGYDFRKKDEPIKYFYPQTGGMKSENIFLSLFRSAVAAYVQALMARKKCIDEAGRFIEEKSFSDIDFIIQLAWQYPAVILYEPLFFRRLHADNYITPNWVKSFHEGADVIKKYRANKKLPAKNANDALFRLYINFGEKYLGYKKHGKAISRFLKAWLYKRVSIVPIKKTGKAIVYFFRKK